MSNAPGVHVSVTVKGDKQLSQRLTKMPENVRNQLRREIHWISLTLFAMVQAKLHGDVLNVDTGLLSQSQNRRVVEAPQVITASVGFNKKTVPYGAIHEFGGRTPPHVILPKRKKALAFVTMGSASMAALSGGSPMVIVKKVNHPGSVMPERSFLRSSLREIAPSAREHIAAAVAAGIKQ